MLVALENVYAVLRSEKPIGPAKQLISDFARDALENGASASGINPAERTSPIGSFVPITVIIVAG